MKKIHLSLYGMLRDYGWLLAFLVLVGAFVWTAYIGPNPVEQVERHVAEPVGQAVGVLPTKCPGGWNSISARDEHTRYELCRSGNWTVSLFSDGKPSHATLQEGERSYFVFWCEDQATRLDCPFGQPAEVPGWPK